MKILSIYFLIILCSLSKYIFAQSNSYVNNSPFIQPCVMKDIEYLCGVNSTFIVLDFLSNKVDYLTLYKKLTSEKNSSVNISDIRRVLSEYNIETHIFMLRPSQLYDNPNCLFIMYTPPPEGMDIGHFSVIRVIDEENVQIIDPPYPPRILKKSDWVSNDKIIFTAVGDNFKPPSKFTQLNIASLIMIIGGISLLAYGKFSKCKPSK